MVALAISWIVAVIAYGSFMENFRHTEIEELLISHIIAHTSWNVFVPLYFVCTTPNLCKYFKSYFPFTKPNQVEPVVHFNNATNNVEIHI